MSKLSKAVMAKIEKEKIVPRPRWQFVLSHSLLWVLLFLSILLGSMVTGMFIHEIALTSWGFVPHLGGYEIWRILLLPVIWLITVVLTVIFTYKTFEHTKKGYKYQPLIIIAASIVISIILGASIFQLQITERFDRMAQENIGPYADWQGHLVEIWELPEEGLLVGEITSIESPEFIKIKTPNGKEWTVDISGVEVPWSVDLTEGEKIMVFGEAEEEGEFKAEIVSPMHRMMREHMPMSSFLQKFERKARMGV